MTQYKDSDHNTDKDAHLHDGENIVFYKDNFSTKMDRVLRDAEIQDVNSRFDKVKEIKSLKI